MEFKKILIGIDDSYQSEKAAAYGFALAKLLNAEVGLVEVVEPMIVPPVTTGIVGGEIDMLTNMPPVDIMNAQDAAAKNVMQRYVAQYGEGHNISQFLETGDAATVLVDTAAKFKADLIVVGSHGRTGFNRFFTGSVAEDVTRHTEIPVMIVPLKDK
ncbi:universal stress protein [Mucilaginibacter arboris]|nr:universal stress protein [Mucilaginibacter arboris]